MNRSDYIRVYFFAKRIRVNTRGSATKREALEVMRLIEQVVGQLETPSAADQT